PWSGPHAQTLLGKALRRRSLDGLRRERWTTPDGDFLDLDFTADPDPARPLAVVLHGLEGNSRRGYCLEAYAALAREDIAAVGVNFRACSGEPNLRARAYHSGETGDLAFVLEGLRDRFPNRVLLALGYSLGGNVLLKYLGEHGEAEPAEVSGAVAVSVPYDLDAGVRRLENTFLGRQLYSRYFLRSLVDKTRLKTHLLDESVHLDAVWNAESIRAFDEALTAPLHGFASAEDYYQRSSSAGFLPHVRVSTLLLHSLDDPFFAAEAVPRPAMADNPWLYPVVTERGGHVGFVGGSLSRPRFWAEESAARFLAGVVRAR
ncbi:MAG: alpha/beta fold hydrolase, partial [Gemmatimonadetes bacterium]|nr:alpha/beta fold hydrolase [Gemmatimonadota bacterium]